MHSELDSKGLVCYIFLRWAGGDECADLFVEGFGKYCGNRYGIQVGRMDYAVDRGSLTMVFEVSVGSSLDIGEAWVVLFHQGLQLYFGCDHLYMSVATGSVGGSWMVFCRLMFGVYTGCGAGDDRRDFLSEMSDGDRNRYFERRLSGVMEVVPVGFGRDYLVCDDGKVVKRCSMLFTGQTVRCSQSRSRGLWRRLWRE